MTRKCNRLITVLLAVALVLTGLPGKLGNKVGVTEEVQAAETINDPRIVADDSMDAGQKVTWDCVWFGSYPQTEIVDDAGTCGTYGNEYWGSSADYEVNPSTYSVLQNASGWDSNGDITLNGTKYRRIKKTDASRSSSYYYYTYSWIDSDTFHYFRYDPIKWRVLDKDGSTALLLADKALDDQEYNTVQTTVTWETSTIRSWLNGYGAGLNQQSIDYSSKNFLDAAFTTAQQNGILISNLVNANNIEFGTEGGNDTNDKIFFLSESEVYTDAAKNYGFESLYFTSDEARRSKTSTYAKAMGTYSSYDSSHGNCCWWLRSPGTYADSAISVYYDGDVIQAGYSVDDDFHGVRPALRFNLTSSDLYSYAGTVSSDGTVNEVGGGSGTDPEDEDPYNNASSYDINAILTSSDSTAGTGKFRMVFDENDLANSSYTYNHRLGRFTAGLSLLVYNKMDSYHKDHSPNNANVERALGPGTDGLNFRHIKSYEDTIKDEYGMSSGSPFWLAHKKVKLDGVNTEILLVSIRGTYHEEWVNNFDLGKNQPDFHKGFLSAANFILKNINEYINDPENSFNKDAPTKLIITGHSRGGAVANLLGYKIDNGELTDLKADPEDVFVYTYATPNVTRLGNTDNSKYKNIFNIVNPEDFVTKVPLSSWGYKRYGVTYVLPSKTTEALEGGDHVNYNQYLEQLRNEYAKYRPNDPEYAPYNLGMLELATYVTETTVTVPSANAYYDVRLINGTQVGGTLHDLYRNSLGAFMSGSSSLKESSKVVMANALIGQYGGLGIDTMRFFIAFEAGSRVVKGLKPNFSCAHRGETYLAGMWALRENEIKAKRRTILGIVNCPVDITVTDASGNTIGEIKNNVVIQADDNVALSVNGDSKSFALPMGGEYSIKLTGNDEGNMDYSLREIDPDTGEVSRIFYPDVPVKDGEALTQDIQIGQELEDIELKDSDGDTVTKHLFDQDSLGGLRAEVVIDGNGSASNYINLTPGDYVTLQAFPEEGNEFVGWYDDAGNLIGVDEQYSFSIQHDMVFTAKFKKLPVPVIPVKTITISGISKQIAAGKKIQLKATVLPKTAKNKKLKWMSSDTKVATVTQSGKVTIKKKTSGKSVIIKATATDGSKKVGSWKIKVMKGEVRKIAIKGAKKALKAGKTMKLKAVVKATKGANKKVQWTTSNTKYATVSSSGKVKALKAGKGKRIKITAMATDGTNKKKVVTLKIK